MARPRFRGAWPDGGVVTQRTANPCTRVRFPVRPPSRLQRLSLIRLVVSLQRSLQVAFRVWPIEALPQALSIHDCDGRSVHSAAPTTRNSLLLQRISSFTANSDRCGDPADGPGRAQRRSHDGRHDHDPRFAVDEIQNAHDADFPTRGRQVATFQQNDKVYKALTR